MSSPFPQGLKQTAIAIGTSLLCLLTIGLLQKPQLTQLVNRSKTLSKEEIEQSLAIEKLKLNVLQTLPSFGFDNLIADWIFLQFLQYFGDTPARLQTGYDLSADYLETVIQRDPRFLDAYLFLSIASSIYSATPERSVAIMSDGASHLKKMASPKLYGCLSAIKLSQTLARFRIGNSAWQPLDRLPFCNLDSPSSIETVAPHFNERQSWLNEWAASDYYYAWDYPETVPKYYYLWRYQGIDQFLFLGDTKAAQKSFLTAANRASLHAALYSDPLSERLSWSSQETAKFIAQNPTSKAAQIRAWMMIFGHVNDDKTRQIAIREIEALGGKFITDSQGNITFQMPPEE